VLEQALTPVVRDGDWVTPWPCGVRVLTLNC